MARYYGSVGFVTTVDKGYGVWESEETVFPYYGDIISNVRRWSDKQDSVNSNLALNNTISIIADKFAFGNLAAIRWAEYMGEKWQVTSATINYPRIELTLGGVYAEEISGGSA